ncbi:hypothetical protein DRW03_33510, partial [Corallococcus sp. H22C18031201]
FANYASVRVLKPDGTQLTSATAYPNQTSTVNFTTTTAGSYVLTVDPYGTNTGQFSMRVNTRTTALAPARAEVKR